MKFPLAFGWWFSAVLTRGPYSRCLNPHIGVYRPQRGGFMLRFPPIWPLWHVDWNKAGLRQLLGRRRARKSARRRQALTFYGIVQDYRLVVRVWGRRRLGVQSFIVRDKKGGETRRLYVVLPWKTFVFNSPMGKAP